MSETEQSESQATQLTEYRVLIPSQRDVSDVLEEALDDALRDEMYLVAGPDGSLDIDDVREVMEAQIDA